VRRGPNCGAETPSPRAAAKPGSAGKAGLNQRIRVVRLSADDSANARAVTGENGEIIVDITSDEAFEGYWRRPDADARALRGGWYFTGDTGYVNAEGDLFVTGRVDDMIVSGGENVSPVEIESVLSLHPAVAEVAVVGLSDERWGQRITAFVLPEAGHRRQPRILLRRWFRIGAGLRFPHRLRDLPLFPARAASRSDPPDRAALRGCKNGRRHPSQGHRHALAAHSRPPGL
jgi:acyl-CoA synthetase (AMP-forming)/AMP-acid ligase II